MRESFPKETEEMQSLELEEEEGRKGRGRKEMGGGRRGSTDGRQRD